MSIILKFLSSQLIQGCGLIWSLPLLSWNGIEIIQQHRAGRGKSNATLNANHQLYALREKEN